MVKLPMSRKLSAYEKNYLLRQGINPTDIDKFGEMPVEYVGGEVQFRELNLTVNPDVLIPRVETEELVELVVARLDDLAAADSEPLRLADIGTGSGAIAISLAVELEKMRLPAEIVATDVSEAALAVAKENAQRILGDRKKSVVNVKFYLSNLLTNLPSQQFDAIIANLPYIPSERLPYLPKSVVAYEPEIALDGGSDGLRLIKLLLTQAKNYLKPNSLVFLEVDYTHTREVLSKLSPGYTVEMIDDSLSRNRFALLRLKTDF